MEKEELFVGRLAKKILEKKSVVCMGLDPRMEKEGQIPQFLIDKYQNPSTIIFEFNKALINKVKDLIPVIKPQIAFYEKYDALDALKETIKYAHKKGLLVILDAKRNDIGSTSEAYADAIFKVYGADACTLNAYLGYDSIKPYLEKYPKKGLFILVKTSNPSSKDFQDLFSTSVEQASNTQIAIHEERFDLERNYIKMAKLVEKWSSKLKRFKGYHNLGVVVGATYPEELKAIREIAEGSFILIPGYGAQGGTAEDVIYGFDKNKLGAIINSSRGIIFAYKKRNYNPNKFAEAAKEEVLEMNKRINNVLGI
jgi:orotidine-5'-phosphate decarboxylase